MFQEFRADERTPRSGPLRRRWCAERGTPRGPTRCHRRHQV